MGVSESTLKTAAVLTVLSRRGLLSEVQKKYINTNEVIEFYEKNRNSIDKHTCSLYIEEIKSLIGTTLIISGIVEELSKYNCPVTNETHELIDMMIKSDNAIMYLSNGDFTALDRYILYDDIIETIKIGDIILYDGIKDVFSNKRAEIVDTTTITLTGLNKEDIATLAIIVAMAMMSVDPSSNRLYILHDILAYVETSKYIESERLNLIINKLGDSLAKGRLLHWDDEYMDKINIKIPQPTIDEEIMLYNAEFRFILRYYPRPIVTRTN